MELAALQGHLAGLILPQAAQALGHLRPARAGQTGNAEDLALAHLEGDVVQGEAVLLPGAAEIAHLQNGVADLHLRLGIHVAHLAAYHPADELLLRHILNGRGVDIGAVPDDRDAVGDFENLLHAVADVQHTHALLLQAGDGTEEGPHLLVGQGGGGLVENQHLGVVGQGLGDLHHLLGGHAQIIDLGIVVDLTGDAQEVEDLVRLLPHGPIVDVGDEPGQLGHRLVAHEHVLQNRQILEETGFLEDDGNSLSISVVGFADGHLLAIEIDFAAVRLMDAGDDLHHRGLAGAVLAAHGVHLPPGQLDLHVLQRLDAGEALVDIL